MTESDSVAVTSENLRGLTHPVRMRVLGLLRIEGPATATMLAAKLGLSSGALSYHLRQLERFGFIVEDDSHHSKRDRWWKAAHHSTTFAPLRDDPVTAEAADLFTEQLAARSIERIAEATRRQRDWTDDWRATIDLSDSVLDLTPTEARQLADDLTAVIARYRQHLPGAVERPAEARPYLIQYQGVPYFESEL